MALGHFNVDEDNTGLIIHDVAVLTICFLMYMGYAPWKIVTKPIMWIYRKIVRRFREDNRLIEPDAEVLRRARGIFVIREALGYPMDGPFHEHIGEGMYY